MSYALASPQDAGHRRHGRVGGLIPFLGLALALSALGWLTTTPALSAWFTHAPRADWSPRTWVFTLVWTAVYFGDAIAGWLLWRGTRSRPRDARAIVCYWIQVALQVGWLIAFLLQTLDAGNLLVLVFAVIVLLDIATAIAATTAWGTSRPAGVVLWIVLAWLLFGTALSGADTLLRGVLL